MRITPRFGISLALLCVTGWVLVPSASGQFRSIIPTAETHNSVLIRYLFGQEPIARNALPPLEPVATAHADLGHKSPFLAAALSLAVPGLGEYYVGDHIWRGMIFTGLEAGLWIGMIHWQNLYNSGQNSFYSYSSAHFSRGRYSLHLDSLLLSDTQWTRTLYPLDRADSNDIGSIHRAEAALDSLKQIYPYLPDSDYTHRLIDPSVDFQQYNEMISKYWQYVSGWDQLENWYTAASLRASAQHEADISRSFLFGIFLNHALSAIDAALLARDHNTAIELHGSILLAPYPDGTMGMIPTANIQYRF